MIKISNQHHVVWYTEVSVMQMIQTSLVPNMHFSNMHFSTLPCTAVCIQIRSSFQFISSLMTIPQCLTIYLLRNNKHMLWNGIIYMYSKSGSTPHFHKNVMFSITFHNFAQSHCITISLQMNYML